MDEFDTPATQLESPITGDDASSDEEATALRTGASLNAADLIEAQAGVDASFARIKAQPTVRIRVHKSQGPQTVIINGARFNVPCNVWVNVPEQVAEELRNAERI